MHILTGTAYPHGYCISFIQGVAIVDDPTALGRSQKQSHFFYCKFLGLMNERENCADILAWLSSLV